MTTSTIHTLSSPDGSATHRSNGYTVLGAVNGPIEVSRRDEQAEEATLEINIRPANGVSTPKERRLEVLLQATLRRLIITNQFPRSLIQLTLQILKTPTSPPLPQFSSSALFLLPSLLTTSLLTLISAGIPLHTTFTPTIALTTDANTTTTKILPIYADDDIALERQMAKDVTGVHVFAVTANGQLLLAESEGDFNVEQWEEACDRVHKVVGLQREENDMDTEDGGTAGKARQWLLNVVNGE